MFLKWNCLLVLSLIHLQRTQGNVIVGGPEPPYPLNNNNVTLNCSTSLEGNIIWSVNEFQLNTEMRLAIWEAQGVIIQNLQPTLSIITIRSRLHLNNTRFRCEVEGPRVIDGIIGVSNLINFTYYDIPSTPTDLMISANFSQPGLQLSWTPGFALANEPVWYVVTISGPQMFESVVTSPSVFIPSVGRSCPRYSLMIQALNEVGTSNGSLKTVQVAPIGLADFRNVQTRVDLDVDMAFLNIIFTDPSPCLEYRVLEYTLALSEVMNSDGVNVSDPLIPYPVNFKGQGSEITIAVNTSSGLLADRLYSVDLVARSLVNSVTTILSVYTTGLQSASISVNISAINATCFFAEGTISRGCLFLSRDSTVLLNISLKSGDVVAMGTAPSTPGLLIEDIVAVEVLENGDPSEIHITPAAVVTLLIPTTQPPDKSSPPSFTSNNRRTFFNFYYTIVTAGGAALLLLVCCIVLIGLIIVCKKSQSRTKKKRMNLKNMEGVHDEITLDTYYTNIDDDFSLSYAEVRNEGHHRSKAVPIPNREKMNAEFAAQAKNDDRLDDSHSYDYPLSVNSGGRLSLTYEEPTTNANKFNTDLEKKDKLGEAAATPQSYVEPLAKDRSKESSSQKGEVDLTQSPSNYNDMAPQYYLDPTPRKHDQAILQESYEEPLPSNKASGSSKQDEVSAPQSYEVPLSITSEEIQFAQNYEEPLSPVGEVGNSLRSSCQQEVESSQTYEPLLKDQEEIVFDQIYEDLVSPAQNTIHFESKGQEEKLSPQPSYEVPITNQNGSKRIGAVDQSQTNWVKGMPVSGDTNKTVSPQVHEMSQCRGRHITKLLSKLQNRQKTQDSSKTLKNETISPQEYEEPSNGVLGQPLDYDEPVPKAQKHSLVPPEEGDTPQSYEMPVSVVEDKAAALRTPHIQSTANRAGRINTKLKSARKVTTK